MRVVPHGVPEPLSHPELHVPKNWLNFTADMRGELDEMCCFCYNVRGSPTLPVFVYAETFSLLRCRESAGFESKKTGGRAHFNKKRGK